MAALRQLLSAKELTGALYPRALPEESRQMVKQKMEAMGYPVSPPAVPTKETPPATNNETQNLRPVKYNKEEPVAKVSNSYEDYDRSIYTSMYEERLSRDMTPALSSSLPYRPNALNVSETQLNKAVYGQRRRSRSVSQDTQNNNNPWDTYNANQGRGLRRKDSARSLSQPPDDQQNNPSSIQTLQDRPNAPQANHASFEPLSKIGQKKRSKHSGSISSYDPLGSNHSSNADSVGSGIKHSLPPLETSSRKRSRDTADLDYTPDQLAAKTYSELATESFDHNPPSFFSENSLTKRLPSPTLPIASRLQAVYDSSTSRAALAKTLFASMPIEMYDECGDTLLEKFADLVARLKAARRNKRKACIAMEDEVAMREKWVRRKRTCVEDGLHDLRSTGMSVIRPKPGGKKG